MNGTAMPEASVDEDCDSRTRKHDVCPPSSEVRQRSEVHAVAEALGVQESTEGQLG